jgi:hypothetical protein
VLRYRISCSSMPVFLCLGCCISSLELDTDCSVHYLLRIKHSITSRLLVGAALSAAHFVSIVLATFFRRSRGRRTGRCQGAAESSFNVRLYWGFLADGSFKLASTPSTCTAAPNSGSPALTTAELDGLNFVYQARNRLAK